MRVAPTRQLIALALAILLIFSPAPTRAEEPREATVAEQLRTAKLMQVALAARGATPKEWQKLDGEYAAMIVRKPTDATVRNAHAEFLWDIGEQSRAVTEWEAAEHLDPRNSIVLEHLGASALALGEARKSAAYYSRAVASDPSNAECHFALANVRFLFRHELLDAAHPDDASLLTDSLAHFAEAARLAPGNADYTRAYAETFYNVPQPDWNAALAAWENFRILSPQKDFALLHLARVNLKLGRNDAAKSCLSRIQGADYQTLKAKLEAQATAPAGSPQRAPLLDP